jgi:hypothetical protein
LIVLLSLNQKPSMLLKNVQSCSMLFNNPF